MFQYKSLIASFLFLVLAACASNVPDPDPVEATYSDDAAATTDGYSDGGFGSGEDVPYDPMGGELATIIYFEFDSSELRPEDSDIVARHAVQLAGNSSLRVRLEGHADERGSREYNIGLGERRSQTVRRMLLIQGASSAQISTVSFGEERPVSFGNDEEAYAQNRRVEITYTN